MSNSASESASARSRDLYCARSRNASWMVDRAKAKPRARRGLRHAIEIALDNGADRGVAAAGNRVAHQQDSLFSAGHLDRADRITNVDHVGGIGAGAERRLAIAELKPGAMNPVADTVGLGRDLPRRAQELRDALLGKPIAAQAHQDAQLGDFRESWQEPRVQAPPRKLGGAAPRRTPVASTSPAAIVRPPIPPKRPSR